MKGTRIRQGERRRLAGGFTLLEMMFSLVIAIAVLGIVADAALRDRFAYEAANALRQMDTSLRLSMQRLALDARNSGYGIAPLVGEFQAWIPSSTGFTGPVAVIQGSTSNASDTILFLGAFGSADAQSAGLAAAGSTSLPVDTPANFNASDKRLIFVGWTEMVRVTGINAGNLLLSSNPTNTAGLSYTYAANTPVELIKCISYTCTVDAAGAPVLVRRLGGLGSATTADTIIGRNIERMKITAWTNAGFTVTFTARASRQDPKYTHPVFLDRYRRAALSARISFRN